MDAARMPLEDGQRMSSIFTSERNENHTERPEIFLGMFIPQVSPRGRLSEERQHSAEPSSRVTVTHRNPNSSCISHFLRKNSNGWFQYSGLLGAVFQMVFALKIGNKMKPTSSANPERGITFSPIYLLVFFYLLHWKLSSSVYQNTFWNADLEEKNLFWNRSLGN